MALHLNRRMLMWWKRLSKLLFSSHRVIQSHVMMRRAAILIAAPSLFLGIERLCHQVTEGFALTRITHPLTQERAFAAPLLNDEEQDNLLKLLSQPFYYLSSGGQSYVFLSQDGHYVIKFLKFHHRRIPGWIEKLPLPSFLAEYRTRKKERKAFRLKRTLNSYVVAYNHLKEETGMLYHHLSPTKNLKRSVILFDRLGYLYELPLDDYAFLVQKRGVSTAQMLHTLMQAGKQKEAEEKLSQLLHFAIKRFQKGIYDRDFKFRSNLGFIDYLPSQIDLGSLSLDPRQALPEVYKPAFYEAAQRFRLWLAKEYPSLTPFFDQEVNEVIQSS